MCLLRSVQCIIGLQSKSNPPSQYLADYFLLVPWEVSAYFQDQLSLQHHQLPPDVPHHLQSSIWNKISNVIVDLLLDQLVHRVVLGGLDQLVDQRISIQCQRGGCTNRDDGASLFNPIHC